MEYTSTVEDYIKQIYLAQPTKEGFVSMKSLSLIMDVAPSSVTVMMKSLRESGLVDYLPRKGSRLTENGRRLALVILRRHRLIERFLVDILGLDWSEVHGDAERLEHAVSDQVVEKMDQMLEHPRYGPHGFPIPGSDGKIVPRELTSLLDLSVDRSATIAEIGESEPELLRYAQETGLVPGQTVTLKNNNPSAGILTVVLGNGKSIVIGTSAAGKIFVDRQAAGFA